MAHPIFLHMQRGWESVSGQQLSQEGDVLTGEKMKGLKMAVLIREYDRHIHESKRILQAYRTHFTRCFEQGTFPPDSQFSVPPQNLYLASKRLLLDETPSAAVVPSSQNTAASTAAPSQYGKDPDPFKYYSLTWNDELVKSFSIHMETTQGDLHAVSQIMSIPVEQLKLHILLQKGKEALSA